LQEHQIVTIQELRDLPDYQFSVFDAGYSREYGDDAEEFLKYGRNVLMTSCDLADDRIVLAKAERRTSAVVLYVDRDTYELVYRDNTGHYHLDGWQFPSEFQDMSMSDLEALMGSWLLERPNWRFEPCWVFIEQSPENALGRPWFRTPHSEEDKDQEFAADDEIWEDDLI